MYEVDLLAVHQYITLITVLLESNQQDLWDPWDLCMGNEHVFHSRLK